MGDFIALPQNKLIIMVRKVIDYAWAFKRKRYPTGSLNKNKYRLCVRGDLKNQAVDYFDMYYPVVQWSTINLLIIVSCILHLETKQVDFILYFFHAKSEPGYFIEMET